MKKLAVGIILLLTLSACGGASSSTGSVLDGGNGLDPVVNAGGDVCTSAGGDCEDLSELNFCGSPLPRTLRLQVSDVLDHFNSEPIDLEQSLFSPLHLYTGFEHDLLQPAPNGELQTRLKLDITTAAENLVSLGEITVNFYFLDTFQQTGEVNLLWSTGAFFGLVDCTQDPGHPECVGSLLSGLVATFDDHDPVYGMFDSVHPDPIQVFMNELGLSRPLVAQVCGATFEYTSGPNVGETITVASNPIFLQFHHGVE